MPGVIRRSREVSDPHPLLGFARGKIGSGVLLASSATTGGVSEQQTITVTGTPTSGTFTLTYDGATTANIAYNASAANVVSALELLPNIGPGGVTATGGALPGTPVVVTFAGNLANQNVSQMTAAHAFGGGTTPAIAITTTRAGSNLDAGILVAKRGMILKKGTDTTKLVPWVGGTDASTLIIGVLARTVEFFGTTPENDEDVPFWAGPGVTFNDVVLALAHSTYSTGSGAADFKTWAAANGNRVGSQAL